MTPNWGVQISYQLLNPKEFSILKKNARLWCSYRGEFLRHIKQRKIFKDQSTQVHTQFITKTSKERKQVHGESHTTVSMAVGCENGEGGPGPRYASIHSNKAGTGIPSLSSNNCNSFSSLSCCWCCSILFVR